MGAYTSDAAVVSEVRQESHDPDAPLTRAAFSDGMKLLSPIHRRIVSDAGEWAAYASGYWLALHGDTAEGSHVAHRQWITNAVWFKTVLAIINTCSEMPSPADTVKACQREHAKLAPPEGQKALPAPDPMAPSARKIRTENARRLRGFQESCAKNGHGMIAKGGLRDQLVHQCEREGYMGDELRLMVAIRYAEARLERPRPVAPRFLGDNGQELSGEWSARWNEKADLDHVLELLRAEHALLESSRVGVVEDSVVE